MTVNENEKRITRLEKAFEKLSGIVTGNGVRGMDEVVRDTEKGLVAINERMDALENAQGITNSELNHFRNVYFTREGLDAMGNPYPQTWLVKTWEEKIAPGLLNNVITAAIIIVLLNIPDLLSLIANLLK